MGNAPKRKGGRGTSPAKPKAAPDSAQLLRKVGIGVGVAAVLGLVVFLATGDSPAGAGIPEGTREVDVEDALHVEGEIHVDEGEVPAGGVHSSQWLNCGFYGQPVQAEFAVHSLEHGAVWITHRPDLGSGDVEDLRDLAERRRKVIVSPVPSQEPLVRVTAWGHQLDLDDPGDSRLLQFVNEFEGSANAPEPGGACTGGVGTPGA